MEEQRVCGGLCLTSRLPGGPSVASSVELLRRPRGLVQTGLLGGLGGSSQPIIAQRLPVVSSSGVNHETCCTSSAPGLCPRDMDASRAGRVNAELGHIPLELGPSSPLLAGNLLYARHCARCSTCHRHQPCRWHRGHLSRSRPGEAAQSEALPVSLRSWDWPAHCCVLMGSLSGFYGHYSVSMPPVPLHEMTQTNEHPNGALWGECPFLSVTPGHVPCLPPCSGQSSGGAVGI